MRVELFFPNSRMLRAILNKSWRQHPTRHQLYGHLPPITKTIQVRRTRHAGHCWRSRDELISDVLLWTPTYGRAKAGRPALTYIQQLCEDMGCSPKDLPEAMNDREKWRERESGISILATRHDDDDDSTAYIYIYTIYIKSSTDRFVSFYQNSSVWLDILASRRRGRNPVNSKRQSKPLRLRHEEAVAAK